MSFFYRKKFIFCESRDQKHSILPEQACFMFDPRITKGHPASEGCVPPLDAYFGRSFVEDNAESLRSFNIFRQQSCTRSSRYKVCLIAKHRGSRCMWPE